MADTPTGGSSRAEPTPSGRTPSGRTPSQRTPIGRVINPDTSAHTPLDRTGPRELVNSVRRGLSNNAPTPHATAARRALEQRRTALFTPGKIRRRSLREQHQTPMNILNQLARRLAPSTQQVVTSSSPADKVPPSSVRTRGDDSDDSGDDYMDADDAREEKGGDYDEDADGDDELPPPPRLSLPLREDDDDTVELRPPRLSEIPDDNHTNYTVRSVELPRERAQSRYSRGSLGSVRVSDYFDPNEPSVDMMGRQSDFFPGGLLEDLQVRAADNAAALERFDNDDVTMRTTGRESEFTMGVPADMADQTTFMMSEPGDDVPATSPLPGASTSRAAERASGGDTNGNISFIPEDPGMGEPPQLGDDDDDDDSRHGEREMMDSYEPTPTRQQDAAQASSRRQEREEDAETGRRRDRPMAEDPEKPFLSEGDDSDPADTTTHPPDASTVLDRSAAPGRRRGPKPGKKKQKRVSRHGTEYPPLPPSFVRRVAHRAVQTSGLSNHRISSDVLAQLTQASEWFFEQLGDDLGAYADHAKRTVIEESDVVTLMKRQRQIGSDATIFSLAQRHLPRELLQELRMPMPVDIKGKRNKSLTRYDDDDDDDASEV